MVGESSSVTESRVAEWLWAERAEQSIFSMTGI